MKSLLSDDRASRWLTRAADTTVIACGWWLIALSVLTCVEMLGRKLLGFSLQGVDEIGSYTYAIVGAFGFAYALITRSHTRVDFLLSRMPVGVGAPLNQVSRHSRARLSLLWRWPRAAISSESLIWHSRFIPCPLSPTTSSRRPARTSKTW